MIGLIKKDLYYLCTSWKMLCISLLIIGVYMTYKGLGIIVIIFLPMLIGTSIMGCIQNDAQKKWYHYNLILPISLKKIIVARYVSYVVFMAIGFVIAVVYGLAITSTMGIESLGKNFALWQGFSLSLSCAFLFAASFLPITYFFKGEKIEICMMVCALVTFGLLMIAFKSLSIFNINPMLYVNEIIIFTFIISLVLFLISWVMSTVIYYKRKNIKV